MAKSYMVYVCLYVFSGGRKIQVTGSGFDQVQRVTMRVLPSSDEFNQKSSAYIEVRVMFVMIIFGLLVKICLIFYLYKEQKPKYVKNTLYGSKESIFRSKDHVS